MLSTKVSSVERHVVEIEELLRAVSTILKKRGRDILSNFEATPPQMSALLVLQESGNLTMGELCQRMYLACSTATDLIDRMERNQLIERVRDTTDRRVIRLRILPKGHTIIEQVLEARRTYLANILAELDSNEKEQMIRSLEQLYSLMNRG